MSRFHGLAVTTFVVFAMLPAYLEPIPLRLNHVAAVVLIGAFSYLVLKSKRLPAVSVGRAGVPRTLILVGSVGVATAGILASVDAADLPASLSFVLRYLLGPAIVVAIAAFQHDAAERATRTQAALVASGALSGALAALGYYWSTLGETTIGVGRRAESLFDHPNQFGMVMVSVLPVTLAHAMAAPRRPLRWAAVAVVTIGVLLSGSFVNTMLLVVGYLLVLLTSFSRFASLSRAVCFLVVTLVLSVMSAVVGPEQFATVSPRVAGMLDSIGGSGALEDRLPSVFQRFELFGMAVEAWGQRPIFGVGGDNAYLYLSNPSGRPVAHAHNLFINTALITGVVGLLAMFVLVSGWLLLAVHLLLRQDFTDPRFRMMARGFGTGLLLLFASNQSSDSLSGTVMYVLWALMGVGLAVAGLPSSRRGERL